MICIKLVATKEVKTLLEKDEEQNLYLKFWLARNSTDLYYSFSHIKENISSEFEHIPSLKEIQLDGYFAQVEVKLESNEDEIIALVKAFYATINYVITTPEQVDIIKKELLNRGLSDISVLSINEFYIDNVINNTATYQEFKTKYEAMKREKFCNLDKR